MNFDNVNVNVSGSQSIIKALQNYNTIILKPNIIDNRNVLTQEMINEKHTKYVIKWNYSLEDATINVPKDCIIEFAGGTIYNGTIIGNNTILIYSKPIDEVCLAERQGTFIYNTTVADEEDITSENGHLKFKDRPVTYGMGKKILRKNIVNGVNTLIQSMINQPNTIYIIQYNFTLGENITIPANCVLDFNGGSINGDYYLVINFTNTKIINCNQKIDIEASLSGQDIIIKDINVKILNQAGIIPTSANNITIQNNKFESDTTVFRLQGQAQTFNHIKFLHNSIKSNGKYGILLNECKGEDVNIIGNDITSETGDAIEGNFPANNYGYNNYFKDVKVIGNTLSSKSEKESEVNAGFAIGFAAGKNVIITNNIIQETRYEGIHIEDVNERYIISNNIIDNCNEDGIVYYYKKNELAESTPLICTGNYIKKRDNLKTNIGIYSVYNSDGFKLIDILSNNIIEGFNIGINTQSNQIKRISIVDGTTIRNCNIGLNGENFFGNIIFENVTQLLNENVRFVESIVCVSPITADTFFGNVTQKDLTLKKLNYSLICQSDGSISKRNLNILPLPSYIDGNLSVYITPKNRQTPYCFATYNIKGSNSGFISNMVTGKKYGTEVYGNIYIDENYIKLDFIDADRTNLEHYIKVIFEGTIKYGGNPVNIGQAYPTSERPSTPYIGCQVFDTTLGKPIYWNGTTWVDATGTTV